MDFRLRISILILSVSMSLIGFGQEFEVDGRVQVNKMDTITSGNLIVVRDSDSLLALIRIEDIFRPLMLKIDSLETKLEVLEKCGQTTIRDFEGNTYNIILIGSQCWSTENLRSTKYSSGESIAEIHDEAQWGNSIVPSFCWYNNDSVAFSSVYGGLYNYYVVSDTNQLNICPVGWHVPSNDDWDILNQFLLNLGNVGGQLKEEGFAHWMPPNTGASNTSGFTALPAGYRNIDGTFQLLRYQTYWWSSTDQTPTNIKTLHLYHDSAFAFFVTQPKSRGLSVRCLKDTNE